MIEALFLALIMLLRWQPDLPISRQFDELLVAPLVRWLLRQDRVSLFKFVFVAGILILGGEMLLVLGSGEALLVYATDLALYLDAILATSIAAKITGIRAAIARPFQRGVARGARPRERRTTPRRELRSANDDDEGRHAFALAV